jgi:hypothetical protein
MSYIHRVATLTARSRARELRSILRVVMRRPWSAIVLSVAVFVGCKSRGANPTALDAGTSVQAIASTPAPLADAAPVGEPDAAVDAAAPVDVPTIAPGTPTLVQPRFVGNLDVLARAIERERKNGREAGAVPLVVYVDTTLDYGCLCPTFVFAPFWNTGRPDGYVMPLFAPGVPEPTLTKQGIYRFVGHFDGRRISGFDWLNLRGDKKREQNQEGMDEYKQKGPVFIVEDWCFEPVKEIDPVYEEAWGKPLHTLEKQGRFCPGSRYPTLAKK